MDHQQDLKEIQLFSGTTPSPPWPPDSSPPPPPKLRPSGHFDGPPLDLELSISVTSLTPPPSPSPLVRKLRKYGGEMDSACVEALKWQAAEQIRLAAIEKAYAERVRELTRREMEMAETEFARARHLWERAREEAERADRMKEKIGMAAAACMEITCHSCRQKFRPYN